MVYLIYTEGHTASSGERLVRGNLCGEAVRLSRLLVELMPDEPEALGLLACLVLSESRRSARVGPVGELVGLAEQDRSVWDRDLIAEGQQLVRQCLRRGQRFEHGLSTCAGVVRPADAAGPHSCRGTEPGDSPRRGRGRGDRAGHRRRPRPAPVRRTSRGRADLLRRLGRIRQAQDAYDDAIACAGDDAERAFLARHRTELVNRPRYE